MNSTSVNASSMDLPSDSSVLGLDANTFGPDSAVGEICATNASLIRDMAQINSSEGAWGMLDGPMDMFASVCSFIGEFSSHADGRFSRMPWIRPRITILANGHC